MSRAPTELRLSERPPFHELRSEDAVLYHRGTIDRPWTDVIAALAGGCFPSGIRGNFAFVFQSPAETIAAVDHLATIPLFYTTRTIGHLFHDVLATVERPTDNVHVRLQMQYLLGHSVGPETTVREIHRLEPGCYLRRGEQVRYQDLANAQGEAPLDLPHFRDTVGAAVERAAGEHNVLLLSGGTDSTTVAAVLRARGLSDRTTFIYADSTLAPFSEREVVDRVEADMGLPVTRVEVKMSGGVVPGLTERLRAFWFDHTFVAKRRAVARTPKNAVLLTGEIGDQLFGGPKTPVLTRRALQRGSPLDSRDLARLWIHLSQSDGLARSPLPGPSIRAIWAEHPLGREVYEWLVHRVASLFNRMATPDLINRILTLNLILKGPFRLYLPSQDTRPWAHPFADWSVVDLALRTTSRAKIANGGMQKAILLQAFEPWITPLPFHRPKAGTRIPRSHAPEDLHDFRPL